MFRHVSMLRWKDGATEAQRAALHDELRALPEKVGTIRSYSVGDDARVNEGNHDLVIVADFDDVDGYLVYRDHPDHVALIQRHILPILDHRAAVQYEVS